VFVRGVYSSIILHLVSYGCETWSLKLREEHRLRVFQNTVLRRMFGTRRKEVAGCWRRLHNKEFHNLYGPPNITMVIMSRMRWHPCSTHGRDEKVIQNFGQRTCTEETTRKIQAQMRM